MKTAGFFLPEQILAYYYSDQQKAFLPLGKETFQFDEPRPKQVNIREIQPSMAITTKQLKLVLFPLKKIPAWHGGKGNHGWLFLDEIKVY